MLLSGQLGYLLPGVQLGPNEAVPGLLAAHLCRSLCHQLHTPGIFSGSHSFGNVSDILSFTSPYLSVDCVWQENFGGMYGVVRKPLISALERAQVKLGSCTSSFFQLISLVREVADRLS